jgi:nanoRNase/pAp phosphatase (c-di-AMP/oligoRNAs hydrolase)
MTAILGDTQGLTNELASAETYQIMAELIELGVNRPALEEKRRELSKMTEKIYRYKGLLIERTEFHADGRIALVSVPHNEIAEYSPLYNPAPLIQGDMLQTNSVEVAIVLKDYNANKITGAIRANTPIGAELAVAMGGGGHPYASGFKVVDGRSLSQVKIDCIAKATELLDRPGKDAA